MSWGSAIAGAFNMASSAITNLQNAKLTELQNQQNLNLYKNQLMHESHMARMAQEFTKNENELAFERDKEMWNMQNAYNSPSEQMKRFKDAGLNPNLIYGQGTPGNATSSPSYNPTSGVKPNSVNRPNMEKPDFSLPQMQPFNLLQDYQALASIDSSKEQANLYSAESAFTDEKTIGQNIDNTYKVAHHELDLQTKEIQNKLNLGLIDKNEAERQLIDVRTKFEQSTFKIRQKYLHTQDTALSNQSDLTIAEQRLKEAQEHNAKMDTDLKAQMLLKISAETANITNQTDKIKKEIEILKQHATQEQIRTRMMEITGQPQMSSNPYTDLMNLVIKDIVDLDTFIQGL